MAGAWNGLSGPKHVVNGSNLLNHAEAAVDGGGGSVLKINWVLTCFDHCGEVFQVCGNEIEGEVLCVSLIIVMFGELEM